jgi:hypothetical protein
MVIVVALALLLPSPPDQGVENRGSSWPLVWRFASGQEFWVEQTHRQLYQLTRDGAQTTAYLDYTLLHRFRVKSVTDQSAELEMLLLRQRVNNPNEAGKPAIDALRKLEGSTRLVRLKKSPTGWTLAVPPPPPNLPAVPPLVRGGKGVVEPEGITSDQSFSAALFTLGTSKLDRDKPDDLQPIETSAGGLGRLILQARATFKQEDSDQRLRLEIRTSLKAVPADSGPLTPPLIKGGMGGVSAAGEGTNSGRPPLTNGEEREKHPLRIESQSVPISTPGIGVFNLGRGRWDYLDFRTATVFKLEHQGRTIELKQDFSAVYRVFNQQPPWN